MVKSAPRRISLPGAREDKLFFAQVREDPTLDILALKPKANEKYVLVGSGGCTALSLLAAEAGEVVAVDLNSTQIHLIELKALALKELSWEKALSFLGASAGSQEERLEQYKELKNSLTEKSRTYWDKNLKSIRRGVLSQGVTEKFLNLIVNVIKLVIHPKKRIEKLLSLKSVDEQKEFYKNEWNNRRWRALFAVLLNRWVFNRTYHPMFFQHVKNPSFANHFYTLFKTAINEIPVSENYFLHQILTGHYPIHAQGGLPPYLSKEGKAKVSQDIEKLTLVDGAYTDYLKTCADGSIHGYTLSNILEWLPEADIEALMKEIIRTSATGARVVIRNFVGWTDLPEKFKDHFEIDKNLGDELIKNERSMMQFRIVPCRIK